MTEKLVEGWQDLWRMASTWASGTGIAILTIWNMMPSSVRNVVPDWLMLLIGGVLWGLVLLARIWKQPKLEAKREERSQNDTEA